MNEIKRVFGWIGGGRTKVDKSAIERDLIWLETNMQRAHYANEAVKLLQPGSIRFIALKDLLDSESLYPNDPDIAFFKDKIERRRKSPSYLLANESAEKLIGMYVDALSMFKISVLGPEFIRHMAVGIARSILKTTIKKE